jgi:hypothetical protein
VIDGIARLKLRIDCHPHQSERDPHGRPSTTGIYCRLRRHHGIRFGQYRKYAIVVVLGGVFLSSLVDCFRRSLHYSLLQNGFDPFLTSLTFLLSLFVWFQQRPKVKNYELLVAAFAIFAVAGGYIAGIQPINQWRFFSWHPFLMTTGMVGLAGIGAITKKLGGYTNTKVQTNHINWPRPSHIRIIAYHLTIILLYSSCTQSLAGWPSSPRPVAFTASTATRKSMGITISNPPTPGVVSVCLFPLYRWVWRVVSFSIPTLALTRPTR